MPYKIEKEFEYLGLPCVCKYFYRGYRTGYVGIGKNHSLCGKDMFELDDYIDIHGSVTYSEAGGKNDLSDGYWWIGFDFAHAGDKRTELEEVEEECKKLAKQLSEYEGEK